jgi:oligopeptide/dipeptide ABC transporter ATP-binding protein
MIGLTIVNHDQTRPILEVEKLKTYFNTPDGVLKAVDGVSFNVDKGQIFGLVGESGCGKSATALSIMGLIPQPPGIIAGGRVNFDGRNLAQYSSAQYRQVRGVDISMIFQEPMTSLNPVHTIAKQISELCIEHLGMSKREARNKCLEMLEQVGIPSAGSQLDQYPHNLSGGMRQRVMIAMALCCRPKLILADEPTTALDVTVQAQILELILALQQSSGSSVLLITHNLGIVAEYAEKVVVMYAGKVVEEASVWDLFENPLHPYTKGLLKSVPRIGSKKQGPKTRLAEIPGSVPSLRNLPQGCNFNPRCNMARKKCGEQEPELKSAGSQRLVACWAVEDGWA